MSKVTKNSMVELVNFFLREFEWKEEETGRSSDVGSSENQTPEMSASTATKDSEKINGGDESEKDEEKDTKKESNISASNATTVCRFYK